MDLLNNYKINNQGSEIANNFKKFGLYDSENRVIVYLEEFNEEKKKRNSKKMYVIQMQSYLHRALEQLKPSHHGLLDNPQEMHQIKGLSL